MSDVFRYEGMPGVSGEAVRAAAMALAGYDDEADFLAEPASQRVWYIGQAQEALSAALPYLK